MVRRANITFNSPINCFARGRSEKPNLFSVNAAIRVSASSLNLRTPQRCYDSVLTLDLIVVGGPSPAPRSIVRMDLVQGTVVEKGYYGLRFDFDDRQTEDTVYVKGTALMHRVSS